MMGLPLFDRKAQVTIGKPGQNGLQWKDLRVVFNIEKTGSSVPNKAEIKIYNLSKRSKAFAEETGNVLTLLAGYAGQIETIYKGAVARPLTTRDGPDWVTNIECGDGLVEYQGASLEQSFAAGTSIKDVYGSVLGQLGLTVGDTSGIKDERLISPMTMTGPARKQLDDLTARQGAQWSIQNEVVQIVGKGKVTKEAAVLLSDNSGLLQIKKKDKGQLEITSLLLGKIIPNKPVLIKSSSFNGLFNPEKVTHKGDTHGQEWYTIIEGNPLVVTT